MSTVQFAIGDKVIYSHNSCVISAFINPDGSLSADPTDWALLTHSSKEAGMQQLKAHVSQLNGKKKGLPPRAIGSMMR